MDGVIYTIDQLGRALIQKDQEIAELRQRLEQLSADVHLRSSGDPAEPDSPDETGRTQGS